jgi:uncharacterized protein (DUF885 family)
MKKILLPIVILAFSILIVKCKSDSKKINFTTLTKNYFNDKNILSPLDATQNGQNEFNADLQLDMTDGFKKQQTAFYEKYEKSLAAIDTTNLSEEEKISYKIMNWEMERGRENLSQNTNLIPMHQFWGTHLTMAQFAEGSSAQPFKTKKDYLNFLSRMEKYAVWIDSAMVYMQKGINEKMVLPKTLTLKMIPQFKDIITKNTTDNIFYSSIKIMPTTFSDADKKELAAKYEAAISKKLMPRYEKMAAFLQNIYLPACRTTSGIGSLPNGKAIYANLVKQWTTTDKTPNEIHELGLKEVARLQAEMEKVKQQVGFKGTLLSFFDVVRNKKELKPFTKPEQVIANFEAIYAKIKPNVDQLFSLQPKTPFRIKRTETFREKTASAEYQQGATDGSRPGTFYVPIPNVLEYNVYGDEDLFLHEAIPGHHFQISLQQESKTLPDFRKFNWFGAYGEGWALYCESLGKELGLYQDPYQYFGMLGNEMHRAVRLVVDTGLHSKGWTREQAIEYSLAHEAESEESIIAEIERYMAIPGQALSYKIGQLKILELRAKAQEKMGKNFDIKTFHQKVLESGVLPLALLEQKINVWINKQN